MRRIINSTYITLDGVIEHPETWPGNGIADDGTGGRIQTELLLGCDAVLMGRRTYDGFAPVWMTRSGDPYSDRINSMPKYVVSRTLRDPTWANTTVLAGDDIADQIASLKQQDGQDIVQYGIGPVTRALIEHDLLDELRLWVHPLLLGRGQADDLLFHPARTTHWDVADTTVLNTGIVILTYRPRS